MNEVTYDCPYCLEHYVLWNEEKGAISLEKHEQYMELVQNALKVGRCKKCKRQNPKIPTTLEMDGLFDEKDIKDRFSIMMPCVDCGKYTKQDRRGEIKHCQYCNGPMGVASQYHYSIRTWNTSKIVTPADRKKMGSRK